MTRPSDVYGPDKARIIRQVHMLGYVIDRFGCDVRNGTEYLAPEANEVIIWQQDRPLHFPRLILRKLT
jgi:hypothetical protein